MNAQALNAQVRKVNIDTALELFSVVVKSGSSLYVHCVPEQLLCVLRVNVSKAWDSTPMYGCCRYRALGVGTSQPEDAEVKRVQKLQKRFDRLHLITAMRSNVIRNLPNNVPY